MFKPDIGVGAFHLLFIYTLYPLVRLLPKKICVIITRYLFPKGFYARYTGVWYRLDDEELPEWVKTVVWKEVFEGHPTNPFDK